MSFPFAYEASKAILLWMVNFSIIEAAWSLFLVFAFAPLLLPFPFIIVTLCYQRHRCFLVAFLPSDFFRHQPGTKPARKRARETLNFLSIEALRRTVRSAAQFQPSSYFRHGKLRARFHPVSSLCHMK